MAAKKKATKKATKKASNYRGKRAVLPCGKGSYGLTIHGIRSLTDAKIATPVDVKSKGVKMPIYMVPDKEQVNHPDHYKANGIEVIDIIDAFNCDYYIGSVLNYVLRYNRKHGSLKDQIIDLKKAHWYLTRKIAEMEKAKES